MTNHLTALAAGNALLSVILFVSYSGLMAAVLQQLS